MKKIISLLLIVMIAVSLTSCEEKETKSEFTNQITLGTGLNPSNYFELSGESSDFYLVGGSAVIYFRVESEEDIAGNDILLEFRTMDDGLINSISRTPGQDYGHILLSSFEWMWTSGTYKVKAYIVKGIDKQFIAETTCNIH